ncbi:RNA polymerase sigma factor [Thermicanus aegyptius]|uniref:RNA polymerase sigma factor n=1 Tax=Thermicanus aegyptius TaxID=94009 RepID=UPI001FE0E3EB|nr:RNA polymerase sigma factor [Thermicanus aegyptius]
MMKWNRWEKPMMTDEQLVEEMAQGNQAAFEAFIHRYHGPLLGYLERMLQDEKKAEDFVQETFLRLLQQLRRKKIPERIRPWLYRVATNLCNDYWRSGRYRSEYLSEEEIPEQKDPRPTVLEIYERQESRKEILSALGQLTEKERQIVFLRFFQELKLQEIAEVMEMPLGSVKSNLFHSLKKLKHHLIEEKKENPEEKEGSSHA